VTLNPTDILELRKTRRWSRRETAERCGLTEAKIANLEQGKRDYKPGEREALEALFGEESSAPVAQPAATPPNPAGDAAGGSPDPNPAPSSEADVFPLTDDELEEDEGVTVEDAPAQGAMIDEHGKVYQFGAVPPLPTGGEPVKPVAEEPKSALDEVLDRIGAYAGELYSNSEFRTAKRCKRKWWLGYYRRLDLMYQSPVGTRHLGTMIHICLAGWYVADGEERTHPLETLAVIGREDADRIPDDDPEQLDAYIKQIDLAKIMLEGYMEWLAETGADQAYRVVAPEMPILAPFPDDTFPDFIAALVGRLDVRLVRTVDDARLFMDHKTVGSVTEPVRTLHMDEQMKQYILLEILDLMAANVDIAVAPRTDGGLYNMLRKVKRTPRANPPFYDRAEVRHNVETMRSFWLQRIGEVQAIHTMRTRLDNGEDHHVVCPPYATHDCTWDCDFFHLCSMLDDGSRAEDFISANYVTVSKTHRYEKDAAGATQDTQGE
jgi:transcriptional regulator with XRE-family HTH domain